MLTASTGWLSPACPPPGKTKEPDGDAGEKTNGTVPLSS
jgi:hypothetical protein